MYIYSTRGVSSAFLKKHTFILPQRPEKTKLNLNFYIKYAILVSVYVQIITGNNWWIPRSLHFFFRRHTYQTTFCLYPYWKWRIRSGKTPVCTSYRLPNFLYYLKKGFSRRFISWYLKVDNKISRQRNWKVEGKTFNIIESRFIKNARFSIFLQDPRYFWWILLYFQLFITWLRSIFIFKLKAFSSTFQFRCRIFFSTFAYRPVKPLFQMIYIRCTRISRKILETDNACTWDFTNFGWSISNDEKVVWQVCLPTEKKNSVFVDLLIYKGIIRGDIQSSETSV